MDTTDKDLAGEVKAARARKRWTQQELADAADVSPSLIQKLEAGRRPHRRNLERILNVLEIDQPTPSGVGPWSTDVALILNSVGLFLEGCTPQERQAWAEKITREFVQSLT